MARKKNTRIPISSPQVRLTFKEESQLRKEEAVAVKCVQCGRQFLQPKWYVEKGIQSKFCGETCRSHWDLETLDHPFELHLEGRPEHRGGNWRTQSQNARERDGFCCQLCGVSEGELGRQLDVHHKVPFRLFESPLEANRLSNLISLCPSCHKKQETLVRDDLPLFDGVKHPGQR